MSERFSDLVREYIFAELRLGDMRRELARAEMMPAMTPPDLLRDIRADYEGCLADAQLKAKALDDRAATADH